MTLSKPLRHLLVWLAALWAGVCLALPAPHDIEQAVANGQLPQAERMLREVLAEKPRSARAHYELAQVLAREGQTPEALQALRTAREIDPSLKFAQSSERFEAVAQAIEQQAAAKSAASPTRPVAPVTSPAPPVAAQPPWLWPALLTVGFALLVLWLWRRMQGQAALRPQPAGMGAYAPEAPRGFGAQYDPRGLGAAYDPRGAATGYGGPAPASSPPAGSGVAGAVVGGLAGVAAGYALSRALDSRDHPASGWGPGGMGASRPSDPVEDIGLVRMDSPGPAGSELGRFDAGRGEGWEAPDPGDTAGDDNW